MDRRDLDWHARRSHYVIEGSGYCRFLAGDEVVWDYGPRNPCPPIKPNRIYLTKTTIYVLLSTVWRWPVPKPGLDPEVAAIRAFNRLYTRKIGW